MSPRTSILMALFFKVSGYALYNHLAYFLLIGMKPDDCLWLDPPWFTYGFALALARSVGILAMSPLHCFIIVF